MNIKKQQLVKILAHSSSQSHHFNQLPLEIKWRGVTPPNLWVLQHLVPLVTGKCHLSGAIQVGAVPKAGNSERSLHTHQNPHPNFQGSSTCNCLFITEWCPRHKEVTIILFSQPPRRTELSLNNFCKGRRGEIPPPFPQVPNLIFHFLGTREF